MWGKRKDKREQDDIDKRMEILQMVKIPPEDSARMRRRLLREIELDRLGIGPEDEIKILQMRQERKQPKPCRGSVFEE